MKILNYCNKIIEYSFYLLFFLVPLTLTGDTSELFEFNKLWVTFIITIIIGGAWFTKMIVKKELRIQRTLLDIPIGLFLVSEIISTFISLDPHTSLWGYYSRFNGGLLSIISYIFLYYAFVSNLKDEQPQNEKENYDFVKGSYVFVGAVILFIVGIIISSQLKPAVEAGIPFQMIATLITAIASFFVFMKAAPKGIIKRSLFAIFSSSLIVILWGLPSHFGFDATCLLFRGTFDVSCWTNDFQPRVRIFSTLGQPDWLAAYLGILIPVLIALTLNFVKAKNIFNKKQLLNKDLLITVGYLALFAGSFASFMYARSRSAIIGLFLALILMLVFYIWFYLKPKAKELRKSIELKIVGIIVALSLVIVFFTGFPSGFLFSQLNNFTAQGIGNLLPKQQTTNKIAAPTPTPAPAAPFSTGELGGTDSTKIRAFVWKGAIEIWKNNPIFGTGLETYAFAYYMYRPAGHNMTSEWQFLYNKAHNDFLNYLATTGTVGILTYLSMIGGFYYFSLKHLYKKRHKLSNNELLIASLVAGYTVINITNFGGFSVVIVNIFFYLIPAFTFSLAGLINFDKAIIFSKSENKNLLLGKFQKASIGVVVIVGAYLIYTLIGYWNADRYYYFGYNYDRAGDYQKAYTFLKMAVSTRPGEPTFQDELAYNNAILGSAVLAQSQKDPAQKQNETIAKQLIQTGVNLTNKITTEHPNNIVFWKTKVRIFYTLSQIDPNYLTLTLQAIKKSATLAPTDADISYNLGVLYGQNGDFKNAAATLENTIKLKPDYKNGQAYFALAVFYHQLALDPKGQVVNQEYNKKAIDTLKLMIQYFGPNQQALDAIKTWGGGL